MTAQEIAEQIREVLDRLSDWEAQMRGPKNADEWARLDARGVVLKDEYIRLLDEFRQACLDERANRMLEKAEER